MGDGHARIGLNLGVRTYFSTEDTAAGQLGKRHRAGSPGSQVPMCQAEGCKADLSTAKHYHRRHKVCEFHSKAPTVIVGAHTQRFCQQCSRYGLNLKILYWESDFLFLGFSFKINTLCSCSFRSPICWRSLYNLLRSLIPTSTSLKETSIILIMNLIWNHVKEWKALIQEFAGPRYIQNVIRALMKMA